MRVFVLDAASVASTRSVQIRRDYFSVVDDASVVLLSAKVLRAMQYNAVELYGIFFKS